MIDRIRHMVEQIERRVKNSGHGDNERLITHVIIPKRDKKKSWLIWDNESFMLQGGNDGMFMFTFKGGQVFCLQAYCREMFETFYQGEDLTQFDIYQVYHENEADIKVTSVKYIFT